MSWRTELYTKLSSIAPLTALISDRIYPEVGPDGAAMPFVTYTAVSQFAEVQHDGYAGVDAMLVQLSAWGRSADEAETVRAALRAGIQGATAGPAIVGKINCRTLRSFRDGRDHCAQVDISFFASP